MNTLNKNALSKSILAGALTLALTSSVNAATESFDVGFRTITDVSITEVQTLSFGATMFNAVGGVCNLDAGEARLADTTLEILRSSVVLSDATTGVSGSGCINSVAAGDKGDSFGLYRVTGIAGADVKVTVNEVIGTDFTFTPDQGCAANYDGQAAGDTCEAFFVGTPVTVTTANSTLPAADDGTGPDGDLIVAVGGKITITQELTSDTNYTEQFTIEATY